jgi:xeroderma pigmentosum group C-complementing protein
VQGLRIRQRVREQYGAQGGVTLIAAGAGDNGEQGKEEDDEGGAQPIVAGGFLTGVEDVVQPYSLPRPTHVVFSSPPRSPSPSSRASSAPAVPASLTSPLAEVVGNDDSDNEDEGALLSTKDLEVNAGAVSASHRQHPRQIPKSMAALAAEVAQAEAAAAAAAQLREEDAASASASTSAAVPPHDTPARRASSRSKSKPDTRATKTNARTPKAQRRRKRARDDEAANASGSVSEWEGTGSDGERRDRDMDMDVNVDMDGSRPRAAKRARKQTQGRSSVHRADADADTDIAGVQVPRSDRVLRTRKGKSAEQHAREREQELAVKRALAG